MEDTWTVGGLGNSWSEGGGLAGSWFEGGLGSSSWPKLCTSSQLPKRPPKAKMLPNRLPRKRPPRRPPRSPPKVRRLMDSSEPEPWTPNPLCPRLTCPPANPSLDSTQLCTPFFLPTPAKDTHQDPRAHPSPQRGKLRQAGWGNPSWCSGSFLGQEGHFPSCALSSSRGDSISPAQHPSLILSPVQRPPHLRTSLLSLKNLPACS